MYHHSWGTYELPFSVHIAPHGDYRPHLLSPECWCHPLADIADDDLYLHNALDQRERVEKRGKFDG